MRLIREEKDFIRDAILLMLPMILQNFVTFSMSMADTFRNPIETGDERSAEKEQDIQAKSGA